jgi:hypothetical protein
MQFEFARPNRIGDASAAEVTRIAVQVATEPRPVIHIHGGLVNKSSGLAGAQRLDSYYRAAGVLPVFPVWESGFFETVGNNWKEIFDEKLFQALLKRLLKHAGGKLLQSAGGRATDTYEPLTDREAAQALNGMRSLILDDRLSATRGMTTNRPVFARTLVVHLAR